LLIANGETPSIFFRFPGLVSDAALMQAATPPQRAQPNTLHIVVECFKCSSVGRHCVVGEEASDDLLDSSPLLGDWLMHPPSQLILDLPERCPHAIAPCYPLHEEPPTAVAFIDEGKTEEVEGFRLSGPTASG